MSYSDIAKLYVGTNIARGLYKAGGVPLLYGGLKAGYHLYRNRREYSSLFKNYVFPISMAYTLRKRSYPSPSRSPNPKRGRTQARSTAVSRGTSTGANTVSRGVQTSAGRKSVVVLRRRRIRRFKRHGRRMMSRRKFMKRRKNVRRERLIRKLAKTQGAEIRETNGGTVTDNFCVVLGHSMALQIVRRAFIEAIVKKVLSRIGENFPDPNTYSNIVKAGDQFSIYGRSNLATTASVTPDSISYTCGNGDSIAAITTGIEAAIVTAFKAGGSLAGNQNWEFITAGYYATGGSTIGATSVIQLAQADVTFFFDSTLKMQNVTAAGVSNTNALDLVAPHLSGKSYFGYGTGTNSSIDIRNYDYNHSFVTNQQSGTIAFPVASDIFEGWYRPPPKGELQGVVSSHNVRFYPAELKKSHLSYAKTMPLKDFLKCVFFAGFDYGGSSFNLNGAAYCKYAKYRAFMLNKEIETVFNQTPATPVSINYMVDQTVGCVVHDKGSKYLNRENYIGVYLPTSG